MKENSQELSEEQLRIRRRNFLIGGAGFLGLSAALISFNRWSYKTATVTAPSDFDVQIMKKDLPLLHEMMLIEGENYRNLPDPVDDSPVLSMDEITQDVFPKIVQATHDFLELDVTKLPKIKGQVIERIAEEFSWSFFLGSGGVAVAGTIIENKLREKSKLGRVIGAVGDLGMLGMLGYVMLNVYMVTSFKGLYQREDHSISVDNSGEIDSVKGTLAHEYVHALVQNLFPEMYELPKWVYEGFAESLSTKVIANSNLVTATKNKYVGESLGSLINAYKGTCEALDVEPSIPDYLDGIKLPVGTSDYSFGYAFFRVREKQHGAGIYRQILEEKSLRAVEPLPVK